MTKFILIGGVAALALAGVAVAQPGQPARAGWGDTDGDGRVSQAEFVAARVAAFTRHDSDGDGTVSAAEAEAAHAARRAEAMERRFARLDANGDGSITREEFAAARDQRRAGRGGHMGGHMGGRMGGWGRGPGVGDGVTRAEVEARAAERFTRMDADGDGYVTAEDRRARMEARRAHRRGPATPAE